MMTTGGIVAPDRAELGNGDLEVGQQLEEKALEFFVRAIELVDQQDRGMLASVRQRLQQRPLDQEFLPNSSRAAFCRSTRPAASISRISRSWRA